jgi:HPr kinase/phosphorylase
VTRATVFGLDVRADRRLPFLQGTSARRTGRTLEVSLAATAGTASWPATATLVSDQRLPDGAVSFQIEADPEAGYRIGGPEYGASVLSIDGRRLLGMLGGGGIDAWQRLLVAQALPFAAVLAGLEVLHASAVVVEGGAVALVGPSGSGKTSLALELCRRGATFLADDVLAFERDGERLLAHPGTPVAGIDRAEADRRRGLPGVEEPEVLAVNSRERIARVPVAAEPVALRGLLFLERRPDGPARPRFEAAADAQALLSSTFNLVLADPPRLERLLDACALAAARCRVERVAYGPATGVAELGEAVERRMDRAR